MILLLDVGNTRIKWRLMQDHRVVGEGFVLRAELSELPARLGPGVDLQAVWVSSVAGPDMAEQIRQLFADRARLPIWFAGSSASVMGLRNSYADPSRMGVDRWLAMLAAWHPTQQPVCILDAGSALTIDFVDGGGAHVGGYIIPGLSLMERALLQDTDRVRFGDAARDRLDPGTSTESAVLNGLLLSQAGAVALALDRIEGEFDLVFTGGDGAALCAAVGRGGQFSENLVLDGLLLLGREAAV